MTQKFTTPCFIRKNTAELRKKLEELGYKLNNGKAWGRFLVTFRIKETKEWKYVASPEWDLKNNPDIDVSIDCGTNDEFFLALTALNESNDYMQWFVDKRGVFVQCKYRQIREFVDIAAINGYDIGGDWLRKATAEEIIEHFKN